MIPMVVLKIAGHWIFACYKAAKRVCTYGFLRRSSSMLHHLPDPLLSYGDITSCSLEGRKVQTLVCDFHGGLLRSPSVFPYFMLMAFEGGSPLRALLLLLSCPVIWVLGNHSEMSLRVMAFLTFCGLRTKDVDLVARAVLPKFYLEDLHLQAYELLASAGHRTIITSMPRLMVEGFLMEYMAVDRVVGAELQVVRGCYFTGLIRGSTMASKVKALKDLCVETGKFDATIVSSSNLHDHLLLSYSMNAYVVYEGRDPAISESSVMPRDKYPKPLIFHDGRLAFFPTPSAVLALFVWLPMGMLVAAFRILLGLLPYQFSLCLAALTGIRIRAVGLANANTRSREGVLYVCTHRTLVDPVMLSAVLRRSVPAVTYSLSRVSELISPIRTLRLSRDRARDAETMQRQLRRGDLAVCPEGTTCREPYLLRFSSLFAELSDELIPVALQAKMSMLYATTASGHKWLDPVAFFADPMPEYLVEILEKVPGNLTCAGGLSATEVANRIQRQLADALGFQPTALTRRDKYVALAGNDGIVRAKPERNSN